MGSSTGPGPRGEGGVQSRETPSGRKKVETERGKPLQVGDPGKSRGPT